VHKNNPEAENNLLKISNDSAILLIKLFVILANVLVTGEGL
jgi:hypothetical protein